MQLYNTRTKRLQDLEPIKPGTVTLYTCGPTVYSEPLIGNWVAYLRWDLLVRTLKAAGYSPRRVMNITDVGHLVSDADDGEDKMQKGARREGVSAWDIADRYTNRFLEGMTALNLQPPEILCKATEHIPEQIALIEKLQASQHTYVIDDGVYFDTSTFQTYADFAGLDLNAMRAGARVEFNAQKRNPSDFALWKFSPGQDKRDMEWDSPWGKGFPGWHIECSAMALKYLGETIDIHTGGIDHIPVHHTNEIAQSEAATGKRFANIWLHANFLLVNGTKISKSLENGYTLGDLIDKGYSPLDFRMFTLQSHYRSESNFTWDNLDAAASRLKHWKETACLRHQAGQQVGQPTTLLHVKDHQENILATLFNDLNSPLALTHIESGLDEVKQKLQASDKQVFTDFLTFIDNCLGLQLVESTPDITQEAKQLVTDREQARISQDWQKSDAIRDELLEQGIGLNDTQNGARWFYV